MAFEIPVPYTWNSTFSVEYKNLDNEHRGLFKAIADCEQNRKCGDTLDRLRKVMKDHFDTEEEMMLKANYAQDLFEPHKVAHDDFIEKLSGLEATEEKPLSDDDVIYVKQWLVDHIKGTDFKYKGQLSESE
uniref:Hemerythrin n=1 Tax=Delaya leruthi TaxID=1963245 RepID=A0A1S6QCJ6_9ANNE|nr:hemerythrin [Delaya leruthi]